MKQLTFGFILGGTITLAAVTGWYLYDSLEPYSESPQVAQNQESGDEAVARVSDDSFEVPESEITQDEIIPEELYEQLDVTDLEYLDTSIANQPDLWRAFFNGPAPMSDPFFEFGCLEYQDTGGRLVVNLFVDNAGRYWVSESVGNELIGIGEISFVDYDRITAYRTQDEEIACLELLARQYDDYYLLSENRELFSNVYAENEFPLGYNLVLLVSNVYLPLPPDVEEHIGSYTGAGREPIFIANRYLVGYGEFGISLFDLETWERTSLFSLDWDNLRGVSEIITYDDESSIIAFAFQAWDDIEPASVIVYDLGTDPNNAIQYQRYATFKWTMGHNETFTLEEPSDLVFNSLDEIWITEYPEFDEKIISGDYPPDPGRKEVTEWNYAAK